MLDQRRGVEPYCGEDGVNVSLIRYSFLLRLITIENTPFFTFRLLPCERDRRIVPVLLSLKIIRFSNSEPDIDSSSIL